VKAGLPARKDIDAVIIATPDHWRGALSIAPVEEGKDVYCEKPMMRVVADGKAVVAAEDPAGPIFQAGSQCSPRRRIRRRYTLNGGPKDQNGNR